MLTAFINQTAFVATSTVQLTGKTGDLLMRMYEQVYEPVNANSDGNLTIILEPDGTASVLYGVYVPEGESCRTIVILYVAYWLMIKGLVSMLIGLNSKVEVVHDIIIMT